MEVDKDFEKEKTIGEEYPYVFSNMWENISHFLKDAFWFLVIGLFILYFGDLRLFLFYAFFVILLMNVINSDVDRFEREMNRMRISDIEIKLNLIAKKLNIKDKDILDYIKAEEKNMERTKASFKSLKKTLCEFGDTLRKIKKHKSK